MYFSTFHSYDSDILFNEEREKVEEKEKEKEKEEEVDSYDCLICYEMKNVIQMQSFYIIRYSCKCNSSFHRTCLMKWIVNKQSCPICRSPLTIKNKCLSWLLNAIWKWKENNHVHHGINAFIEFHEERRRDHMVLLFCFHLIGIFIKFIFLYVTTFTFIFSVVFLLSK